MAINLTGNQIQFVESIFYPQKKQRDGKLDDLEMKTLTDYAKQFDTENDGVDQGDIMAVFEKLNINYTPQSDEPPGRGFYDFEYARLDFKRLFNKNKRLSFRTETNGYH